MEVLILNNIDKNILNWLEDVVEDCNCKIERKEWKSKYNSYVIYDYEPFCSDGFEINLVVTGQKSNVDFLKYLYANKVRTLQHLNSCYEAVYKKPGFLERCLK